MGRHRPSGSPTGRTGLNLAEAIRERVSEPGTTVRLAPGRVNLIGEHTDYSDLPVLPMAIDRSIVVRPITGSRPGIRIDSQRYTGHAIELDVDSEMTSLEGWHRYALGAAMCTGGVSEATLAGGADVLIGGDLPSQGGLSSSSALTVALVAVLSALRGERLDNDELVARAVEAERLTGVAGGSMDQNVIVRAAASYAMRIDFNPLSIEHIAFPEQFAVVAAHSGTTADKGEGAKAHYNGRVLGCRIAAGQLAAMLGEREVEHPRLAAVARIPGVTGAIAALPEQVAVDELNDRNLGRRLLEGLDVDTSRRVPVRACADHVLPEAARVDDAVEAMGDGDIARLGRLFDDSHASLQRFGASTPSLDGVAASMRAAGAAGARLTGAGFGGYAIAVCTPERLDAVLVAGADAGGGPAFRVRASKGLT